MIDRAVLDTSILIKSIFEPQSSLSKDLFERELATHEKCKTLIRLLANKNIDVYIPKVCIVETAAVVKRLAGRNLAKTISRRAMESYEMIDESILFESAWTVAIDTGCSGFDSYFIALAKIKNAILLTDDSGMYIHARAESVDAALVREITSEWMENLFEEIK
jgi:predicted nucleic acid-binding protein